MRTSNIAYLPPPPDNFEGWPWTSTRSFTPGSGTGLGELPSIGIVVPSFNQGRYLEATLRSIFLQGYSKRTVVVMDGGSHDESVDILRKYDKLLSYWVSAPDAGQSDGIARGMARLQSDWCGWLNSDDLLLPGALTAVAAHIRQHPECSWIAGDGVFVKEDGETEIFVQRSASYAFEELLDYGADKFLPQPSVFFRRNLFNQVGGIDLALRYSMDLDLWLRMRAETSLCHMPVSLSRLRQHDDAKTVRDNERAMGEIYAVVKKYATSCRLSTRVRVLVQMRKRLAAGACVAALAAHFRGERGNALRGLARAALTYPPIVLERGFAAVLARAGLPMVVRQRLLERP